MGVTEMDFRQAMADVNNQMQLMECALTARIALAESEVLSLRSRGDDNAKSGKSGILDARKIYPIKLSDMGRWSLGPSASCAGPRCSRLSWPRL